MKRIYSLLVILMLFVSMTVHAGNILDGCQDAMYFRTTKTDSPNNVELSLFLKNSSFAIKSLQCTIVLPQGVSFVTEGSDYKITKTDAIDSNWTLMARHKTGDPDNSAIVLLYNDSNTDQIATGNRKVASIPLTLSAPDALNGTGIYIKDVTLTGPDLTEYSGASYAFNFYTLTYLVDGVEYKTEDLKAGDAIIPTPAPTREGHTFTGWSDVPEAMPAGNVDIIGSFLVNKYTLTYMVDGAVYSQDSIEYGTAITTIEEPTLVGNTFSGWINAVDTMPSHDVVISGTFNLNNYSVRYYVDSVTYQTVIYSYGSKIEALAEPTKVGYTFSGWSEIPATMPAQDIAITGSFTVNKYLLTYMVDGALYHQDSIAYGTSISLIEEPSLAGSTFSGWTNTVETMPSHNVVISGSFGVNNYQVKYYVDGEVYQTVIYPYGSEIEALAEPSKVGYTFSGWSEIPATMPAQDIDIAGSFMVNKYLLTYMVDGVLYHQDSIAYGTTITIIEEPSLAGSTFSGWTNTVETMPSHNMVISGSFGVNSYQVKYYVDGEVYQTVTYPYGSEIETLKEPSKVGYTFSGWSDIPATMPAQDIDITGSFTINSYVLTYKVDGDVYQTDTLKYNSVITALNAPSKDGYTFSGWSAIPASMPAQDFEINGSFSINTYSLVYKVDGKDYKTVTYRYGDTITVETDPTKTGYTFSGWSDIPATMPAQDIDVTGSFSINSYILTYKVDGIVYQTDTLKYNSVITALLAPTKEGYMFSGWSNVPETMPAMNVEITGTFGIQKYSLVYMIDGEVYRQDSIEYGAEISAVAEPEREGETFSGWINVPETMPSHDWVISGTFDANSYLVKYYVDSVVYQTVIYPFGSEIEALAEPSKVGYTFSGWSEIPAVMPSHNVDVTGSFSINSYKLTYMVDGEVYNSDSLAFASPIVALGAPSMEGYTFSGWSNIPASMPAENVVITGSFSINSYNLIYKVDGKEYKLLAYEYGDTITGMAEPSKVGYTFSGWSNIPVIMPAQDVEIVGSFSVNSYNLVYMVDESEYKSLTYNYGDTITAEINPAKVGYTFSGWSAIPATMPAQNVVIVGSFSINSYNLVYMVDETEYKRFVYKYSDSVLVETEPSKVGYTFSGWSNIPAIMPAEDVVIVGSFSINSYSLAYMVDEKEYKRSTYKYGDTIIVESEPSKTGYTFSGWSAVPSTMPAQDIEIVGSFTINKYILSYVVDGNVYKKDTIEYNSNITALVALTKEGYTFSGWSEIPAVMPAQDVEVTGSFSINSYVLTYELDGAVYNKDTLTYASTIIALSAPSKVGYTFSGWSDIPSTMPAANVDITGSFIVNKYQLTYMVDGSVYQQDSIEYGTAVTLIEDPSLEGYTFSGWANAVDTMPSRDVIISGTFSVNSYLVKFYVDSVVYQTVIYPYGSAIVALAEPTKVGYTFSGWSDIPATMPAQDIDIAGAFSINSYLLTYMVEGNVYKTDSIQYNAVITALESPTKEGYTFSGWNGLPSTMPAENVIVTGSYYINYYNLVYKVDGKEYKTVTYKYSDSITVETNPSKEGYTFSGWSVVPDVMPAQDIEVIGSFSINSYLLTYIVDGNVYKTDTIQYNAAITALEDLTKEGYTFSGWSNIPKTMPAEDVEIIGSFIINKYSITYMVDGTIYSQDSIEYGAVVTIIEEPAHEGMTFSGWDITVDSMPSHDVVISGTFTPNIYQLVVMVDGKVVYSDSIAYGTRLADYVDLIKEKGIDITQWELYDKIETITMPAHDVIINAVLNAVRPVMPAVEDDVIYDLTGRRIEVDDISTLPSGIYIRNGRKIVIR